MIYKKLAIGILGIFVLIQVACSSKTIKGTWQYDGGIYNGKSQSASSDYKMQRTYTENTYEAFMIEDDVKPEKYTSGKYETKGDSLFITSDYSIQPSPLIGKTIVYKFNIMDEKLTINGLLPNGMKVEEYWKRVK